MSQTLRSCQERLAAFAACNTADPLGYESREILAPAAGG
jgi:hypothetical protein